MKLRPTMTLAELAIRELHLTYLSRDVITLEYLVHPTRVTTRTLPTVVQLAAHRDHTI